MGKFFQYFIKTKFGLIDCTIEQPDKNVNKPYVLFSHGFGASYNNLIPLQYLKRNYYLMGLNYPNMGRSTIAELKSPLKLEDLYEILLEVLKQTKTKKFDFEVQPNLEPDNLFLMGHSMGGWISINMFDKHIAKHTILVAPMNPYAIQDETKLWRAHNWLIPKTIEYSIDAMTHLFYKPNQTLANQIKVKMMLTYKQYVASLKPYEYIVEHQMTNRDYLLKSTELYKHSEWYTLICGEEDEFTTDDEMKKLVKNYNALYYPINNCGHATFAQKPDKVNEIINLIVAQKN